MTYKSIFVSLNELEAMATLLEVGVDVAGRFDAHLTGLYVVPGPALYPAVGPYAVPEVNDIGTQYFEERAKDTRLKFESAMRSADISFDWREIKATSPDVSSTVSEVGRVADLLILSETDTKTTMGVELEFVTNVIMDSGRPVLILPRQSPSKLQLRQIVCGYNGSKESARAIHDALPFLLPAGDVRLVWVDPSRKSESAGPLRGSDMAEVLDRHGIRVTTEAMARSGQDVGETLLTRAQDLGADLIVMGAHGHSRLREYVLGGATRSALSNIRIPLLMSH
jgi:nucleotide-binding universal stress UspA family protein